ncbi:hypothetical protein D9V28_00685 [Mycetocola zhadangensis]|uniref:Uncharacterized protein n=1 Tax=Mycetocola zhadangensis TaxID=1164595 RepID=A0A3L7J542_9MICO|nr:hypothetical protein D9V28_00685 [Mycetocola zhadangensis]
MGRFLLSATKQGLGGVSSDGESEPAAPGGGADRQGEPVRTAVRQPQRTQATTATVWSYGIQCGLITADEAGLVHSRGEADAARQHSI